MSDRFVQLVLRMLKDQALSKESAHALLQEHLEAPRGERRGGASDPRIAVIGLSCRMPRAEGREQFWQNLVDQVDCIGELPEARRADTDPLLRLVPPDELTGAEVYRRGGYLDQVDRFDHELFGVPAGEAKYIDPQQRIFLELAHEALEDAGLGGDRLRGSRTGVFVGSCHNQYHAFVGEASPAAIPGNLIPFIASRVSYLFDWSGPSLAVDTTCSSALVAVQLGCDAIRSGQCGAALVGAVNLSLFPANLRSDVVRVAGITSPDWRCRPFDRAANGIVCGEGGAALLLKALPDAIADGDPIHAVILGGALNHDGRSSSIAAPNPAAQEALLRAAWAAAGVDPRTLTYIEAHGTATRLGDPIELTALRRAFAASTRDRHFCGIGSVKSNIGHLVDGASGIAGLVKVVLALKERTLPATLHFTEPNPLFDWAESPVYVVDETQPWDSGPGPLRAGVSAFGFNGTNCHLVLEEAPPAPRGEPAPGPHLFALSARTRDALATLIARARARAARLGDDELADACFTLAAGRHHHRERVAIVAQDAADLREKLDILARDSAAHDTARGIFRAPAAPEACSAFAADRLRAAASAYVRGEPLDSDALFLAPRRRVNMPTSPFARTRHWYDADPGRARPADPTLAPDPLRRRAATSEGDPRGPEDIAGAIRAMWRDLLGAGAVRGEGSFFELGGDSVLAMQLLAQCRSRFRVELPVDDFFAEPTLAALIAAVRAPALGARGPEAGAPPIPVRLRGEDLPLSFAQQRFWFMHHLDTGSPYYNVRLTLRLDGRLDVAALRESLAEIGRRHEILRTTYPTDERGAPRQHVHPEAGIDLVEVNADDAPPDLREAAAIERAAAFLGRPFDLARGPVWRAALLRVSPERYLFAVAIHHIAADIWSMKVLMEELAALYAARVSGRARPLPALPIQYADYAAWERDELRGERLERLLGAIRERLAGAPSGDLLPPDRPRGARRSVEGTTLPLELSRELSAAVKETCRREGVSPFMLLLAAFQAVLSLETGRRDIVVGTEIMNRTRPETEALIGAFVNQLVLRTDLSGNPSFRELLGRVRRVTADAFAHQEVPFDQLVERLAPERSSSHTPLFQVKFLFDNIHAKTRIGADIGLSMEVVPSPIEISPFDLTLRMSEEADHLSGTVTFAAQLFERATIERLVASYQALLAAALARPDAALSELGASAGRGGASSAPPEDALRRALRTSQRRRVRPAGASLVTARPLREGERFPLLVEPATAGVDLPRWVAEHRAEIEDQLLRHGAVLFRGFDIDSVEEFRRVSLAVHPELVEYSEPATPRHEYEDRIYVSSEYPSYHSIHLHSELSYTYAWPMKALFFCKQPAARGGETPIADNREILARLDPRVRERFIQKQVTYLRNYGDGLLIPWEKVFVTRDPAEVEAYCRRNAPMRWEWKEGNRLRTWSTRPSVEVHPVTGERVWFNQAYIFHIHSLGREVAQRLLSQFAEEDLPVHAYYGDGTPIEEWEIDCVFRALTESSHSFPWQKGDVILVDNMLMSHGRNAFEGAREIVVSFVEPNARWVERQRRAEEEAAEQR